LGAPPGWSRRSSGERVPPLAAPASKAVSRPRLLPPMRKRRSDPLTQRREFLAARSSSASTAARNDGFGPAAVPPPNRLTSLTVVRNMVAPFEPAKGLAVGAPVRSGAEN